MKGAQRQKAAGAAVATTWQGRRPADEKEPWMRAATAQVKTASAATANLRPYRVNGAWSKQGADTC